MSKVITYKNEGAKGVFSQIKLNSGERILISIGDNIIKIYKLGLFGAIPTKTIWQYPNFREFFDLLGYKKHPLDVFVDMAKESGSIAELCGKADEFVNNLKRGK